MTTAYLEVPDAWVEAADQMDVSVNEYVRRMCRAGRRQFGYDYDSSETPSEPKGLKLESDSTTDIKSELKEWVHQNLSVDSAIDIEDLVDLLEGDLVQAADELCDEDRAKYRRTEGGYLKEVDDE